jgi:transcriptional/translational regulatory protein YebC/TACO1
VVNEEATIIVYTPREQLAAVETALTNAGYEVEEGELRWEAKNEVALPVDKAMANMRLMNELEELDDVQTVASNLQITDEVIAAFETA